MITQHCYRRMRAGIQLGQSRQAHGSRGRAFFAWGNRLGHITKPCHRTFLSPSSVASRLVFSPFPLQHKPVVSFLSSRGFFSATGDHSHAPSNHRATCISTPFLVYSVSNHGLRRRTPPLISPIGPSPPSTPPQASVHRDAPAPAHRRAPA